MPSYLGPGRLATLSAAAYSVPQPSLTPIPLRSIPFVPAPLRSLCSEFHKTPGRSSDLSGVRSAHLLTLESPQDFLVNRSQAKEFTRLPERPGAQSLQMSISTTAKSRQSTIPCRHPILPAPLRSSRQTVGIYVT